MMQKKIQSNNKTKQYPLSRLVTIPPKSYPSANIISDEITELGNYLPSASTYEIIERFCAGLGGAKSGRMLSITGPYGSGKSTMALFLKSLVSPENSDEWNTGYALLRHGSSDVAKTLVTARGKSHTHQKGMIQCIAIARREPITITLLRALDSGATKYFGKYSKKHFSQAGNLRNMIQDLPRKIPTSAELIDVITEMCAVVPMLIMIDEFGKSIEYFTTNETQQSDLFLLQELAEMSGRRKKIPLTIITLQHMAFEEYAVGSSLTQKQEWSKIQGRFEDIPFANSPDQTRLLVSKTIQLTKDLNLRIMINEWAQKEAERMNDLGIRSTDPKLIASCYPLSPLALEILPELCSRYGQYERTLLSFISDAGKHTVATFIDENHYSEDSLPVIGVDTLYDYFIYGTNMIHSSSANITRLMEIDTIIRDSHGLSDLEIEALKTIGMLNLVGRSGYLRASKRMIDYAIKNNAGQILKKLEKKSIITHRKHADEYRIWHGTDIDIAAMLDICRKQYHKFSLFEILQEITNLDPIVAAKHSIETGTMRLFEQRFTTKSEMPIKGDYDGIIIYSKEKLPSSEYDKPIITVTTKNTVDLRRAAVEVHAIQDILGSNKGVVRDWVARKELEERLAEAEIRLDREFANSYGNTARWSSYVGGKRISEKGTLSSIVSKVCDRTYSDTPRIYNEMINKTVPSSQGSAARRKLLECMMAYPGKHRFGLDGFGPEVAIYEAFFATTKIHVRFGNDYKLQDPSEPYIKPAWNFMLNKIKKSKKRVVISEIYDAVKLPPYGMKDGVVALFMSTILLIHKNNIALYEHGSYVPYVTIEIIERLIKNPGHFEVKYFKSTPSKKELLRTVISDFDINSKGSVLDIVSHLVRIVSALPPYVKKTKRLDRNVLAVRDTVLEAIEPDTLLFESLPEALRFDIKSSKSIAKFSKALTKHTTALQNESIKMIADIKEMLFASTGIHDRKKLSKTASVMLKSVTDQKMKIFLTALTTDTLERDEDWINYVALSLTNIPPMSWKDDDRELFENNLMEISNKFKRLASIHFANISENFANPSYQVIVTHADGRERHNIVSLRPEQKKRLESMANEIIRNMKKKEFSSKDILSSLVAILSSKSR